MFYSLAALVRKILFLPLENKIHIFMPPCTILYVLRLQAVFFIRTSTSTPSRAAADSFDRVRSGPVFDLSSINTGISTEWR